MDKENKILQQKKLKYTIHSCSSFSSSYLPQNILEDKPSDQASRFLISILYFVGKKSNLDIFLQTRII